MRIGIPAFLCLILANGPAQARIWYVDPVGTGDAPTIQAAIDSSVAGDVVELACGTYVAWGIMMKSGITLRSATGQPDCVTIDGQQPQGFGSILFCSGVDDATRIEGLTITGGNANDSFFGATGGGLDVSYGSALTVVRCVITGNYARGGGGVAIYGSQPTFIDCEISGNASLFYPGGVEIGLGSTLTAYGTTIADNTGSSGHEDGELDEGCAAAFHCCTLDLARWLLDGAYVIDDSDCDPVTIERETWGALKSLYR